MAHTSSERATETVLFVGMCARETVFAAWGTLNSRRAATPLMRLVDRGEKWEIPDPSQGVLHQNWGGTE
ncbi:hypothetical protein TNCV_535391 [Trichonephila clavipes]|nr:hypothetical protein TNCV_535391 [Trichonephila clavipes]